MHSSMYHTSSNCQLVVTITNPQWQIETHCIKSLILWVALVLYCHYRLLQLIPLLELWCYFTLHVVSDSIASVDWKCYYRCANTIATVDCTTIILLIWVVASATAACYNYIAMCTVLLLWLSFNFDLDIALVGQDKNMCFVKVLWNLGMICIKVNKMVVYDNWFIILTQCIHSTIGYDMHTLNKGKYNSRGWAM